MHSQLQSAKSKAKERTEKKVILDNVSGYLEPRSMLALMGPSGSGAPLVRFCVRLLQPVMGGARGVLRAGKTTLLDVLAGRTPSNLTTEGSIKVNGRPTKMTYGKVAYVPQHDPLGGALTVRETLTFTAKLRCATTSQVRQLAVPTWRAPACFSGTSQSSSRSSSYMVPVWVQCEVFSSRASAQGGCSPRGPGPCLGGRHAGGHHLHQGHLRWAETAPFNCERGHR